MKWVLLLAVPALAGTGFILSSGGAFDLGWPPAERASADGTQRSHRRHSHIGHVADERRLIFANGVVEGKHRSVELSFEIEGRIESVDVREGQSVTAGQPLARLNDDVWRAKLDAARAELTVATARRQRLANAASREAREVALAQLKVAEVRAEQTARDFDRGYQLRQSGAITQQQWDDIQHRHSVAVAEATLARAQAAEVTAAARADDLDVADAQITQARAAIYEAQVMLDKAQLRAPCDGLILRVDAESGELISKYEPRPILTLTNLEEVRVRAYVEELDALAVSSGDRGYVTADGRPGHRYAATVIETGPAMHAKHVFANRPGERVDVKVREVVLRLEDAADLVVGLPVDVFIERQGPQAPAQESDGGDEEAGAGQRSPSTGSHAQPGTNDGRPHATQLPALNPQPIMPSALESPRRRAGQEAN